MNTDVKSNAHTMRKFHNFIKMCLYQKYCKNKNSLLDLGCGRGGDMYKWHTVGIEKVIGIDVNKSAVCEAIRRYKNQTDLNLRSYSFYFTTPKNIFIEFLRYKQLFQTFDNISCMFVLHYFFDNEQNVNNIFDQISKSLVKGGHFFGTIMDGDSVARHIAETEIYNNKAVFIKKEYKTHMRYGNKIQFMLSGTLYFGEKTISNEYLIYKDVLQDVGKKHGLELIEYESFKHYNHSNVTLNEDFRQASYLYHTFAFRKL